MLTENNTDDSAKKPRWGKIVHVKSSLEPKDEQYALFIGRWQPLHDGHKELFERALERGKNVCIAIRDGEVDENNPYTALEVFDRIMTEYRELVQEKRVRIIVIPDICSVNFGRGVGYSIVEHLPPPEVFKISATKIRQEMKKAGSL